MRIVSPNTFSVIAVLTIAISGCAAIKQSKPRPLSIAVAVTVDGAGTLSVAQVVQIHQALRPELERAGYNFADNNAAADMVLTVSFIPIPGGAGGRIKITSLEPTDQFRNATQSGETPEAKEWRRRERELQAIVESQGLHPDF